MRQENDVSDDETVDESIDAKNERKLHETAENASHGMLDVDDREIIGVDDDEWYKKESWYRSDIYSEQLSDNTSLDIHEKSSTSSDENDDDEPLECKRKRTIPFECDMCGEMSVTDMRCNSRFEEVCPACAERWRKKNYRKYKRAMNKLEFKYKVPKFVTLTLRKIPAQYEKRMKKIWKMAQYWRYQMNRKYDADIQAWVGVIEPPNHIHFIVDMNYVPKSDMSQMWGNITTSEFGEEFGQQDSMIVDVRGIKDEASVNYMRDLGSAVNYLMGYMTKMSKKSFSDFGMNIQAFENQNLIMSHNILTVLDDDDYMGKCPHCGARGYLRPVPMWAFDDWFNGSDFENPPPLRGGGGENCGS